MINKTVINTITDEQKARFPEFVDKWVKIGLSTEPADFDTAEKYVLSNSTYCCIDPLSPKIDFVSKRFCF